MSPTAIHALDPGQRPEQPVPHTHRAPPKSLRLPFPPDTRHRVDPTTVFPYRTIGLVEMGFPNGEVYGGTGTMIDEYRVLTCGHNLYSAGDGGMARWVSFSCAHNGGAEPFGRIHARHIAVPEEFRDAALPNPNAHGGVVQDYTRFAWDYGLIVLSRPLEEPGSLAMYPAPDAMLEDKEVGIYGYPDDKDPPDTMWGAQKALSGVDEPFLFYTLPTYDGQSGSAVLASYANLPAPEVPRIVGIHVAGSLAIESNFAVRLTDDVINWVLEVG